MYTKLLILAAAAFFVTIITFSHLGGQMRRGGKILISGDKNSCGKLQKLISEAGYETCIMGTVHTTKLVKRVIEQSCPNLIVTRFYLEDRFFGPEIARDCNGKGIRVIVVLSARKVDESIRAVIAEVQELQSVQILTEGNECGIVNAIMIAMGERFPFRPFRF